MTCVCNVIIFATWLTTRHVQIWKHTYQVVTNALSISVAAPIAEIAHKTPLMIKTGALTQRQILPQLPFGCIIQATRSNWRLGTFLDYPSFYTTESTGNFFVAHSRITMRGGRDGTNRQTRSFGFQFRLVPGSMNEDLHCTTWKLGSLNIFKYLARWGYRDSLLETAQEAVTIVATRGHRWAQQMWQKRYLLSVCI